MPKPSPRKLGKARDISESPDGKMKASMLESSMVDGGDGEMKVQRRKINKKILAEI